MSELQVGDRVSFLRMSNKAVKLTGKLEIICDDGKCAEIKVDGSEHLEMASIGDVTPLETPAEGVAAKSFTTVNGKAI